MTELALVATVVAKEGQLEAVQAALATLVEPTRREEGCLEYNFHQSQDDPNTFVFYERWQSEQHLQQHVASAHFVACQQMMDGLVAGKQLQLLNRLA